MMLAAHQSILANIRPTFRTTSNLFRANKSWTSNSRSQDISLSLFPTVSSTILAGTTPSNRRHVSSSADFPAEVLPPDLMMRVEPTPRYKPEHGGLRFTKEGDELNDGRYEIIRKLGFGDSSTVWLAEDRLQKDSPCVAIKIIQDSHSRAFGHNEIERLYTLDVHQRKSDHPGRLHVPKTLNFFQEHSTNGEHTCIVSELMELDLMLLDRVMFASAPTPEFALKPIMRDVLLALDFCHNVCGIVHCDVKIENVVLRSKNPIRPFQCSGSSDTFTIEHDDGVDKISVEPTLPYFVKPDNPNNPKWWNSSKFVLNDFAFSVPLDPEYSEDGLGDRSMKGARIGLGPPACYRAPEVLLDCDWGTPSDIWSAGCMLFTALAGRPIYPSKAPAFVIPALQWRHCGDFPMDLVRDNDVAALLFDTRTGRLKEHLVSGFAFGAPTGDVDPGIQYATHVPLDKHFEYITGGRKFSDNLKDFIARMLDLDPRTRATAKQLLSHRWLIGST
ncbi:kinase-like protein [Dendrothele bispora CBS 962.96]|uniref:non-specific serine/threonine protein kinase n=1 Tax=Dendrothele bispora (strain CBS 962.96) TaxID=1314807 RepID=A0A4V4HEC0_DENBC|nr:kinase-like protein [Dendrothele bispora CBS 962.96]